MGAEARQAARVQPAAARGDRHQLRRPARRSGAAAVGAATSSRSTRDTQLPLEAGRATGRHAVAPAEPAALRPVGAARDRGLRRSSSRASRSASSAPTARAFSRIFSGHVGIDPYTTAVSDVYQDLFHEGSYVGKGIYDVDAFEPSLAGRVPENRCSATTSSKARSRAAALCTDIHVIDDYPPHYLSFAARQHRWVRGDWQIARWIWPTVPRRERRGRRRTRCRRSRAGRSSTTCAAAWSPPSLVVLLVAGMDRPARVAGAVDDAGAAGHRVSRVHAARALGDEPPGRGAAAGAHPRRARQHPRRPSPGGAVAGHAGASERGDARCDRPRR